MMVELEPYPLDPIRWSTAWRREVSGGRRRGALTPGLRLTAAATVLSANFGQHFGFEKSLDHQHKADRGNQQHQRRDRRDLIIPGKACREHDEREGGHVRHPDKIGAGELVERFEKNEDRACHQARHCQRQGYGQCSAPCRGADVAGGELELRIDRREGRRGDPDGDHQPMDRMDQDDAENRSVEPDHVEQACDIEIDGKVRERLRQQQDQQDQPATRHSARPSANPAGTARRRQTTTVMEAISTLVPRAATASLVGLNTSPQYLKPQVSGNLWGKYHWIATAHSTKLASGPKIIKARPPSRPPRNNQPRAVLTAYRRLPRYAADKSRPPARRSHRRRSPAHWRRRSRYRN